MGEYGSPAQGNRLLPEMKQQKCFVESFVGFFSVEIYQWKMSYLSWFLIV